MVESLLQLEAAGASAVVLPSLFEEQVEHDLDLLEHGASYGSSLSPESNDGYFPSLDTYNTGSDRYLDLLIEAKKALRIPVIASLNGTSDGGWVHYATELQDEGADAIELNVYHVAADPDLRAADMERRYLLLVESVRASIDIPLAVKIGPFFSSTGNMVRQLAEVGADGVVLFNRFYQPDIDLDTLEVVPNLVLSTPAEMRLVLRWMAILRGRVDVDLAATTGVHDADGVIKLILAGADVTMMASALLHHGPEHLTHVLAGVECWLGDHGYDSIDQARGSVSQANVPDPSAFERTNYMKTLVSYAPTS
ncbi:MAG: dihydroorotate dehydrogenase-like protein [Acidimicrobiales bacterium]